jgi:hypothetical protein
VIITKRKPFLGASTVILLLMLGVCPALARPVATQSTLAAPTNPSSASTLAPVPTAAAQSKPANPEVKKESELKHNIVKYLGYSLFALIVLAFGSGFFKKKKVYRTIHHALAFTLIGVAILHGILALTL